MTFIRIILLSCYLPVIFFLVNLISSLHEFEEKEFSTNAIFLYEIMLLSRFKTFKLFYTIHIQNIVLLLNLISTLNVIITFMRTSSKQIMLY